MKMFNAVRDPRIQMPFINIGEFSIVNSLSPSLIRNVEGDNVSASGSTTMLNITSVDGNTLTLNNLPQNLICSTDIDWFVQSLDPADFNSSEPSYYGDYLVQDKIVSFDFDNNKITLVDATGFSAGKDICIYSPWANYTFLAGQKDNGILYSVSKPAWRDGSESSGPTWWDGVNSRYIMLFGGYSGTNYQLGFAYSADLITWTVGNADAPIIENSDDAKFADHVNSTGNAIDNGDGTVSFIINGNDGTNRNVLLGTCDKDDPTTITWGATNLITATDEFSGGIAFFDGVYHLLTSTMTSPNYEDRYNKHYTCATIGGSYTLLANMWTTEYNGNDSHWLEGHSTNCMPFVENGMMYAIVCGTQRYTISGIQGNRVFGLMKYEGGSWSALNDFEPSLIHPMYFYNIPSEDYGWAGGHTGGHPSFIKKDGKCYMFFAFLKTTNTYQVAALELKKR